MVDRTSVLATHLSELVRRHAPELLGRQETQRLLDALSKSSPKLVEELVPERFTVGQIQKVLQALLRERVSVRDLQTIGETMADAADAGDLQEVVNRVRQALARSLVRPMLVDRTLQAVTLSPQVEQRIREMLEPGPDGQALPPDPRITQALVHQVAEAVQASPAGTQPVVLCATPESRTVLRRLTESVLPTVSFLSAREVPDDVRVRALGQVG